MTEKENKAKFNLLQKASEVSDKKGNVFLVSLQEIVQENGSKSEHIVLTKIKRNVDGSQNGVTKSLFIPVSLAEEVTSTIDSLLPKKSKRL